MTTSLNVTLLTKLVTKTILPTPACEHARKVYHDIKALAVLGVYVRPKVTYFPPTEGLESGYEVIETQVGKIRGSSDMLASEWVEQYHIALISHNPIGLTSSQYMVLKSKFKRIEKDEEVTIALPDINASLADLSNILVPQARRLEKPLKIGEVPNRFAIVGMDGNITIFEIGKTKHKTLLKLSPIQ